MAEADDKGTGSRGAAGPAGSGDAAGPEGSGGAGPAESAAGPGDAGAAPVDAAPLAHDDQPVGGAGPDRSAGPDGAGGPDQSGGPGGPSASDPVGESTDGGEATVPIPRPADDEATVRIPATAQPRPRLTAAGAMIAVLLALLGFTLVVQLKTNSGDSSLATMRQEDLVRVLSDLEAQEERLRQDIRGLEDSQRQLNSGAEGQQAALQEATRRADELGILAGKLPASGPGLSVRFAPVGKPIAASRVLDAVQELRGAGAEVMQISGGDGATVRIIASTYFLDDEGGISVGGRRLIGPYTIMVVGDPTTMRTALNIPGGVVASVTGDGGNVIVQERDVVSVTALAPQKDLQYARPVS